MVKNKVKQYHAFYYTQNSLGEITITQDKYTPITSAVLDDARRIIREKIDIPEDEPVAIVCWQRYEQENEQ